MGGTGFEPVAVQQRRQIVLGASDESSQRQGNCQSHKGSPVHSTRKVNRLLVEPKAATLLPADRSQESGARSQDQRAEVRGQKPAGTPDKRRREFARTGGKFVESKERAIRNRKEKQKGRIMSVRGINGT